MLAGVFKLAGHKSCGLFPESHGLILSALLAIAGIGYALDSFGALACK